jgi:hypothetical protein
LAARRGGEVVVAPPQSQVVGGQRVGSKRWVVGGGEALGVPELGAAGGVGRRRVMDRRRWPIVRSAYRVTGRGLARSEKILLPLTSKKRTEEVIQVSSCVSEEVIQASSCVSVKEMPSSQLPSQLHPQKVTIMHKRRVYIA